MIVVIIVIVGVVGIRAFNHFKTNSKTTKIGFEDIGELDTQVAYVTVVDTIEDLRKIGWVTIPFTESKYIYSYDVVVKAGLDFDKIKWSLQDKKIVVKLPKPIVTDCYIDEDSGKVYHEKESVFSPITLTEEMKQRKKLTEKGKKNALDNGLIDKSKENAEVLLTSLFKQNSKYKDYEIEYRWES